MQPVRRPSASRGRRIAAALALAALASLAVPAVAQPAPATPAASGSACFAGDALYRDVVAYSDIGFKTSGSANDHEVARWMAEAFADRGLVVRTDRTPARQFFPELTRLDVDGRLLDAYPVWFPAATPDGGVAGALAPEAAVGTGQVALIAHGRGADGAAPATPLRAKLRAAAAAGAAAAVVIIPYPAGEWSATNSFIDTPIPSVVVGARHAAWLAEAAAAGKPARVTVRGRVDAAAPVYWVEGRRDGSEPAAPVIVVSTPLSAFTQAASERGPGVALIRAVACWIAEAPRRHSFVLVAPGGHEIDGVGVRDYLAHHAPDPAATHSWLHLGASIATWDWEGANESFRLLARQSPRTRLLTNREAIRDRLAAEFSAMPYQPQMATTAVGYLGLLFERGYPTWGFEGAGAFHHLPNDGPHATGPELLEAAGRAIERTLTGLDAAAPQ